VVHAKMLSAGRVSQLVNCWAAAVVSCCCEKLVAEARDSLGPQGSGVSNIEAAAKQRLVKTVTD
jgi:hypothetical protein